MFNAYLRGVFGLFFNKLRLQYGYVKKIGVDASLIADVMLYNIEIAQTFSDEKRPKQDSFYVCMLKSFNEAVQFLEETGLQHEFDSRINKIVEKTWNQNWFNKAAFEKSLD